MSPAAARWARAMPARCGWKARTIRSRTATSCTSASPREAPAATDPRVPHRLPARMAVPLCDAVRKELLQLPIEEVGKFVEARCRRVEFVLPRTGFRHQCALAIDERHLRSSGQGC